MRMYQKLIINYLIQNACYIPSRVTNIELDRKVILKSIKNFKNQENVNREQSKENRSCNVIFSTLEIIFYDILQ